MLARQQEALLMSLRPSAHKSERVAKSQMAT